MKLDDDDFTLFGLPPRFALDRSGLDARWRSLQAEVHPDRFASEGAAAQRVAMQWAVRVNEAYQRLKNPLTRGAYLAGLRGARVDAERNTAMPLDFLQQQMAWREALDDASGLRALESLEQEVDAQYRQRLQALERALDVQADAADAAQHVRALMFIERFREDIGRRIEQNHA
ncbi:MAG: Fe-S protein assembly co-chaperone HscB [Rubrivivax sp.]|jgi:molecular chaperone HscB|nr:Fe-S protein assembly co-chaperone HscB [Rubrivivax sp.]